jgi:hypothetical protein
MHGGVLASAQNVRGRVGAKLTLTWAGEQYAGRSERAIRHSPRAHALCECGAGSGCTHVALAQQLLTQAFTGHDNRMCRLMNLSSAPSQERRMMCCAQSPLRQAPRPLSGSCLVDSTNYCLHLAFREVSSRARDLFGGGITFSQPHTSMLARCQCSTRAIDVGARTDSQNFLKLPIDVPSPGLPWGGGGGAQAGAGLVGMCTSFPV